jgi:hypothetical protein
VLSGSGSTDTDDDEELLAFDDRLSAKEMVEVFRINSPQRFLEPRLGSGRRVAAWRC